MYLSGAGAISIKGVVALPDDLGPGSSLGPLPHLDNYLAALVVAVHHEPKNYTHG